MMDINEFHFFITDYIVVLRANLLHIKKMRFFTYIYFKYLIYTVDTIYIKKSKSSKKTMLSRL